MTQNESETELEKYILQQYSWESLPTDVKKSMAHSKDTWKQNVIRYSIRHQLRWKKNLVKTFVKNERYYYEGVIKYSKAHFMLYPYHLSDVLIKGLRLTPFKYYLDIIMDVMVTDKSYDVLPNFTAADCVRLLGIGRNQYIDMMNQLKVKQANKNWFLQKKQTILREMLPKAPRSIPMQHWWIANIGVVSEEDVQSCQKVEHAIIDLLIDEGPKQIGTLPKSAVESLYNRGLIYFDVPISNNDQIIVHPLQDFVMNRVCGDYFENLLYTVFVSLDERTTVEKLAKLLDIDVELVKQAVSMYIRLGLATNRNVEPLIPGTTPSDEIGKSIQTAWHHSWQKAALEASTATNTVPTTLKRHNDADAPITTSPTSTPPVRRVTPRDADTKLLTPTKLPSLNSETNNPTNTNNPTANALHPEEISSNPKSTPQDDHKKRLAFLFDSTLAAYLMMGNLADGLKTHAVTMFEVGKLGEREMDDFLAELDKVDNILTDEPTQAYFEHAITLRNTLRFLRYNKNIRIKGCDGGVELLRCERLNSISHDAQIRVMNRNYGLLISMAPISTEKLTITCAIPHHFGPVIPEVNSAWFKMFCYSVAGEGPDSALFPKGTRVNILPPTFENCMTVTLHAWDRDPITVDTTYLLPTLNEALLTSPVLVQVHSYHFGQDPSTIDITFPMESSLVSYCENERDYTRENLYTHPTIQALSKHMNLRYSCGFVRMILIEDPSRNLYKWVPLDVFFGIPLFNESTNRQVCEKIEQFNLFSEHNLAVHSKKSRELALKLLDFIAQVNAAGSTDDIIEYGSIPLPTQTIFWPSNLKLPISTY